MKIHAIRTGSVQVHERQRAGEGHGVLRMIRTLLDPNWSDLLPIWAWVVEHPEGVLLVDTGETARASQPGYFPRWHPYYRLAVRMHVRPEDEVGPRLDALGISPRDVRWVVLTHLHTDHAGGLSHLPDAEVLVSRTEYRQARGIMGKVRGYLPNRWPEWFAPTLVDFRPEPYGPFPESHPLTSAGDVRLVPTPGHTGGHLSVVAERGDRTLFFAGDTSYTQAAMEAGIVDGVASIGGGEQAAATTLERIRALGRERDLTYLPSHDPESARRLAAAVGTPESAV